MDHIADEQHPEKIHTIENILKGLIGIISAVSDVRFCNSFRNKSILQTVTMQPTIMQMHQPYVGNV